MTLKKTQQQLQQKWHFLSNKDQKMVLGIAFLILSAFLWLVALQPAWQTVRQTPIQQTKINAQMQDMNAWRTEGLLLQSQPKISTTEAQQALQNTVNTALAGTTGSGKTTESQLSNTGNQSTLALKNTNSNVILALVTQGNNNAHATLTGMKLQKSNQANTTVWNGSLTWQLPN